MQELDDDHGIKRRDSYMDRYKDQVNTVTPVSSVPSAQPTGSYGCEKCFPMFLGGSDLEPGLTKGSLNARACDKLRCLECDHQIARYPNNKWRADCEYLFFRNYIRNRPELEKGLVPAKGNCAYACQCKWQSVT